MAKLLKKDFKAFVGPYIKGAHRYTNNYLVGVKPNPVPAGVVVSHHGSHKSDGAKVEWDQVEGLTVEVSMCRRPRVVCNVPTPFSLYTFMYCAKLNGEAIAYADTMDQFVTNVFRGLAKRGIERKSA